MHVHFHSTDKLSIAWKIMYLQKMLQLAMARNETELDALNSDVVGNRAFLGYTVKPII